MTSRRSIALLALLGLLAAPGLRAVGVSDLNVPERRKAVVEMAQRIAQVVPPPAIPGDLRQPFNPPGFDQPDPDERAAVQAAQRANAAATAAQAAPEAGPTDRELLKELAQRVSPSGTIQLGANTFLMFDRKIVRTGSIFTVKYKDSSYDLELISIERTSFTLRLNREEITRTIEPGKTP